MPNPRHQLFTRTLLGVLCLAAPLSAGVLFEERFETPSISGYEQGVTPPDRWVRAAQGYGSGDHGMVDKDSGEFSALPGNDQAYACRYTNSGITTAEGVLGPPLAAGGNYQVSFDVVKDNSNGGRAYNVRLIAFADGAVRNDCRSTPANSTLLASATGNAPADGSIAAATFTFTSGTTNPGKDLGIRVIGASTSAIIDNIRFRTIAGTASGVNLVTTTPPDNEAKALTYVPLLAVFDKNIAAGSGNITLRDLTDPLQPLDTVIPVADPRVAITGTLIEIQAGDLLQWGKSYAILIDAGAIAQTPGGTPFAGIANETTWNFATSVGDPLLYSVARLKDHINGAITLSVAEINAIKLDLDTVAYRFAESPASITALLDLIATYDAVLKPLWVARTFPKREDVTNDLHWTIFNVMQNIMDRIYTKDTVAAHEVLLDGFKFGSSANFPGYCAPPANPANTHTATISASYLDTFGRKTISDGPFTFARKPTGTYLAPGSIATVTVPPSMVGTGYRIRVGCHSWDFGAKPDIKRLDRVSRTYDITALQTKVANPLGGGIYLEVPFLANAGVVNVDITGAVRSPYFSAKSFHTTTAAEWDAERAHPAPWADFQTDKFMMQVPKSWVSAMPGLAAVQLMADWDAAMDALHDLLGYPHVRGKESLYPQVDLLLKNSVYAPGYPSVNTTYSPGGSYGGYAGSHLVRGPQFAPYYEFHELGHGYFFPKFPGESESNVNLLHVAVMNRAFGKSLDEGHRTSMGGDNAYQTLDTTAMAWMCVFNFSPREVPMDSVEKQYQLKGHAKFVDIAYLCGWDKLDAYWYGMMLDDENNIPYSTSIDALLLRLCKAVGKDIRPLFHFWGIHPQNPASLAASIAAANIPPDPDIKDRLLHYKSLVPADNAAFRTFATGWWGKQPSIEGYWEQREHARQWDSTPLYGPGDQQRSEETNPGEIYNENSASDIRRRVDELVELYFPSILGPDPMRFAIAPAALNALTIRMTATTATAPTAPIEYYFENTTNGNHSGWISSATWDNTGLITGVRYEFRVKARDGGLAETQWSATAGATPVADTAPPTPNPMFFASAPSAVDVSSITMTATAATDINGVQYFFECTLGDGPDSGWQTSREFIATGLAPGTRYTYVVRARDPDFNTTADSAAASATTLVPDIISPLVSAFSPLHEAANVAIGTNLVATFDEDILIGSGNITLRNLTDGPGGDIVIAITDGTQVAVSRAVLTINPTANLPSGKTYAVRIDGTAIDDLSGNSFAGITNDTTWSFTTEVVPNYWTQATGGTQLWSDGANWQGGSVPNPVAGDTMDFSTVNLAADTSLTLGADRSARLWKFGDTSGNQNWTVNAGGQMILAGTTPTIQVNQNTTTLNNVVVGTSGLRKAGAGTLVLGGNNNYSGGTTLSGGAVRVRTNTALGTGDVTLTANSSLGSDLYKDGTVTLANHINVGAFNLTLAQPSTYYTTNMTGVVSGTGTITTNTGTNTGSTLSNNSNTFAGRLVIAGGNTLNVNSIGDGSSVEIGGGTGQGSLNFGSGTGVAMNFLARFINLTGTTGGAFMRNNASSAASAVMFGTNLTISGTGNKTFTLGGSNTGANTLAGNIPGGPGASVVNLTKADAGRWILLGNNAYTGATTISAGTLGMNSIADYGTNCALGAPASGAIVMGSGSSTATLLYTGAGHSSNRIIQIGNATANNTGGAAIMNNGSGELVFTAPDFNPAIAGITATRILTLGGSHTGGGNQIQGVIRDNNGTTGKVNLTKANDASTWILRGANTYTGTTTISGGTLLVNRPGSLGSAGAVAVNGTSTLGGDGTIGGSVTVAATANLAPGASFGTLAISGGLNLSAPANNGAGKLIYEIGAIGASDQITVGGALTIGSGLLGFSDFVLTAHPGMQNGTYTLISFNTLSGTLAASGLSGPVGNGGTGTLQRNGNNIELVVSGLTGGPGPVDHFVISPITPPQTVGTPITGITITARDASNETASGFTGTVTFGGTGGFSGTSASFTAGVLSGISITPTAAGSNLTLTVNDGSGHTGSATIPTLQTQYASWSGGAAFDADANSDGVANGLAWLLGAAHPNANATVLPVVRHSGGNLVLSFSCLKVAKRGGAVLNLQFSRDLGQADPWASHEAFVPDADSTVSGVAFSTSPNANPDLVNVQATIPASAASPGTMLFARLYATNP